MKKVSLRSILLFLLLISIPVLSQAKTFDSQRYVIQSDSTIQNASVCYEVFGMDCPGCESALEKQLKKIASIKKVKASWEKQQVEIWTFENTEIPKEEIIKRIKKANFTPGESIKSEKNKKINEK
ncbi:MAG: heavy metal-associated domain-containing protein [Bacteroidales bacterium]|jgi:copper chaperone CopZ|nr:heavy metal-associated domain-containing protein [Bacteroidales bacterium]